MKFTKEDIEKLAIDIYAALRKYKADDDVSLYYNGKRMSLLNGETEYKENIHPVDYCRYASQHNILTITSEGVLYDIYDMDFEFPEWLRSIWESCGLYAECNESWCWSLYPVDDRYSEIEYDVKELEEEEYIFLGKEDIPNEFQMIMECWWKASEQTGDIGGCVVGAGMNFRYKNKKYKMRPASPYQGEGSWTKWVPMIKEMLIAIGATEINWEYGRLD